MPHNVQATADERIDVLGLNPAGAPRFDGDRRLAARRGGRLEITGRVRVLRAVGRDDDVIEPEGP